jgi:hypothetical protein
LGREILSSKIANIQSRDHRSRFTPRFYTRQTNPSAHAIDRDHWSQLYRKALFSDDAAGSLLRRKLRLYGLGSLCWKARAGLADLGCDARCADSCN